MIVSCAPEAEIAGKECAHRILMKIGVLIVVLWIEIFVVEFSL